MKSEWDFGKAGWRTLLRDLFDRPEPLPPRCAAMMSNLELYVTDELNGVDVRARHPDEWEHLQICAECRSEYDDLRDLLRAEAGGALAVLDPGAPDTAFGTKLKPMPPDEPWRAIIEQRTGLRPSLRFVFSPIYLRESLRTGARIHQGAYRSGGQVLSPEDGGLVGSVLLLDYVEQTPAGEIAVRLSAHPAADPRERLLLVQTVAEFAVRHAELTWSGQTWQAAVGPDGAALLGPVPLSALDLPPILAGDFTLRLIS